MTMEAGGDAASCDRDDHVFHLDGVVHDSASCSYLEREPSSHASYGVLSLHSCLSSASSPSSCGESCSCASSSWWMMTETSRIASSLSLTPLVPKV